MLPGLETPLFLASDFLFSAPLGASDSFNWSWSPLFNFLESTNILFVSFQEVLAADGIYHGIIFMRFMGPRTCV